MIWLFLSAALAFTACNKPVQPVAWEYQRAEWLSDFSSVQIQITASALTDSVVRIDCFSGSDLLDAMGKLRWELVNASENHGDAVYYFKRPLGQGHDLYLFDEHYKKPGQIGPAH